MANAARIEDSVVVDVVVVPDNLDNDESDMAIQEYLNSIGMDGNWIRTSYNGSIRGIFAGIGDTYDPEKDIFVPNE